MAKRNIYIQDHVFFRLLQEQARQGATFSYICSQAFEYWLKELDRQRRAQPPAETLAGGDQ